MIPSILLIGGSVRVGSVNAAVIATVADLVEAPFATDTYGGLSDLPHFNPDLDHDPLPAQVAKLRAAIRDASALLISTPEYAGAMPGALKNLLEWTVGGVEISEKPTGWINPSTNPLRAENTYASLATVLEYTGAALVDGACVDVPVSRQSIGADGIIHDQTIRRAISEAIGALTQSLG
jgi:NAD(P)H-dependent FMN reductase